MAVSTYPSVGASVIPIVALIEPLPSAHTLVSKITVGKHDLYTFDLPVQSAIYRYTLRTSDRHAIYRGRNTSQHFWQESLAAERVLNPRIHFSNFIVSTLLVTSSRLRKLFGNPTTKPLITWQTYSFDYVEPVREVIEDMVNSKIALNGIPTDIGFFLLSRYEYFDLARLIFAAFLHLSDQRRETTPTGDASRDH